MFHLMFVNIIFSLVWVAEWPPFGKELFVFWLFVILVISRFGFEDGIWVLIALVLSHCIPVTYTILKAKHKWSDCLPAALISQSSKMGFVIAQH